jgi:two-component system, chemotaxis family, protein-glutamate methylesterase/glutaminase
MPGRDIVVIGASAGGVESLRSLVAGLPARFPAAVFAVVHFPADQLSFLPRILGRSGPLSAAHAQSGESIQPSRIYVAPPNYHMTLEDGRVHVDWGPRINHCRPAIDPLLRSAARSCGNRVIGLLLSGLLNDGTAGLMAVERGGGLAIV